MYLYQTENLILHTFVVEKSRNCCTPRFGSHGKLYESAICEIPSITHPMPQRT
jgi:hypothetical protein